jgi:lysophospholipid acyltransferase (LPLAT)-like uncharacterized protein
MAKAAAQRSGVVVPKSISWSGRWAGAAICGAGRLLDFTIRYRSDPMAARRILEQCNPAIFCSWHNRLALSLFVYNRFIKAPQPSRRLAAMVSASKDGGLFAHVMERFGVEPVRGSTSPSRPTVRAAPATRSKMA